VAEEPINNDPTFFRNNWDLSGYENRLEIYSANYENGKWSNIKPFEYNNPQYSVGHPALSPDGKILYFVSDMPGGYGGDDIYYCEALPNGKWNAPVNAGNVINTEWKEVFPYIDKVGTLYFASDNPNGMGGLDLYYAKGSKNKWSKPVNLGYPINSSKDDFSIFVTASGKTGYFSSNRDGGKGEDDIYSFSPIPDKKHVLCVRTLELLNDNSLTGIQNAQVGISNNEENYKKTISSNYKGESFDEVALPPSSYIFSMTKAGYYPKSKTINVKRSDEDTVYVDLITKKIDSVAIIKRKNDSIAFKKKTDSLTLIATKKAVIAKKADSLALITKKAIIAKKADSLAVVAKKAVIARKADSIATVAKNAVIAKKKADSLAVVVKKAIIARKADSVAAVTKNAAIAKKKADSLAVVAKKTIIVKKADSVAAITKVIKPLVFTGLTKEQVEKNINLIAGAKIIIRNNENKLIDSLQSDDKGKFSISFEYNRTYLFTVLKDGYYTQTKKITAKQAAGKNNISVESVTSTMKNGILSENKTNDVIAMKDTIYNDIFLNKIIINQSIIVNNIYYDFNSWDIRPDAAMELDKIVDMLKKNPNISIELSSHTDKRGSAEYNLYLSQKRAESAANYIISKGISANRIIAKGYGKTKLINNCDVCTDADHQMNRRTEFKVIKIDK
jgi:outer membrane protein OmpA-like peptidoglycan-associated protein